MVIDVICWYSQQEAPVKAAIIIGSVTIFTVCLGFYIKDYLIPISLERRKAKVNKISVFRNYRTPLKESANSLKRRLDEIFRTRSHLLWKGNPNNDFYNYKIISTNYRLCSLLGWIYAFRIEESYLQVPDKNLHRQMMGQLNAFSNSLADGQGVEMDVASRYLALLDINTSNLKGGVVEKFSIKIDQLIHDAISPENKHLLEDASMENQEKFLLSLSLLIKELFNKDIDKEKLGKVGVIKAGSVRLGLIYRDWQQGIGDLMIKPRQGSSGRSYDVISFREFENMVSDSEHINQKWYKRVARLFEDLDTSKDSLYDNRIDQLRNINETLSEFIDALDRCEV